MEWYYLKNLQTYNQYLEFLLTIKKLAEDTFLTGVQKLLDTCFLRNKIFWPFFSFLPPKAEIFMIGYYNKIQKCSIL